MDFRLDDEVMASFIQETGDRLEEIEQGLMDLERFGMDMELVNDIFRSAHSMKAGANLLKFKNIETLTHRLENILDAYRNQDLTPAKAHYRTFTACLDMLFSLLENLETSDERDITPIIQRLDRIAAS